MVTEPETLSKSGEEFTIEPAPRTNSRAFMQLVVCLRDLRVFLLFSGVHLGIVADRINIGALSQFQFDLKGSAPTAKQWEQIDNALEMMFSCLTETQRRKFLLSQFPSWVPYTAVVCLFLAVSGLLMAVSLNDPYSSLCAYMLWLATIGTLGAISFVAMNVLSVQDDVTFDLTSSRLLATRILIGALFGIVLALPFGSERFAQFATHLGDGKEFAPADALNQAMFLLLPFVLGFSTSLVILLLNRLIDGAQTVFGNKPAGTIANSSPPPIQIAPRRLEPSTAKFTSRPFGADTDSRKAFGARRSLGSTNAQAAARANFRIVSVRRRSER